jgi:mannose-1-phosphate guanylyltransferase
MGRRLSFGPMRYAVIMAGGSGTRLWPMSRAERPKQLLPMIRRPGGGEPVSLLEMAAERIHDLVPPERRYICTAEAYRDAIKAALPEFSDDRILGEPAPRDTVNAVGFAAAVLHKLDPGAIFAVLTADHLIEPRAVFRERMDLGYRLVEADPGRLVTFSIKPTHPATGFGYVERGQPIGGVPGADGLAFRVARFVEKPSLERAQAYVESGHFAWNSGMFIFKAATFLECLKRYKPESYEGVMKIAEAWGTPRQREVLEEVYPTLPKISVDYAVMEPASREPPPSPVLAKGKTAAVHPTVCTVLMDLTWLDVGSWPAYAQTLTPDREGNRAGAAAENGGAVFGPGTRDSMVVSDEPGHTVALLGCKDLIVVHTKDATLVMPRAMAEELKSLHAMLEPRLK